MKDPRAFLTTDQFIQLGWITLYLVIAVAIPLTFVGGIAFWKSDNSAGSFTKLIISAQVLKMTTVILIAFAVTMLLVMGKIAADAAVGVLGSIAGYVLGGLAKGETQQEAGENQTKTRK